ncbi:MAG: lipid A export permease/ATP-binding protein MsbA [Syntrophorhabdaceae bacterium]|nr:lipid A export permease/ATP-binding protein MsbA [Syntrophorhabdaceae bacterium]MDD4196942.1 lipid A export permease/ATP-binding protein MsbA [Syntrophorhabdaceae bacterium]
MNLYLRLLRFAYPYKTKLILAMIFMALCSGSKSLSAYLVKPVLDSIFFEKDMAKLYIMPAIVILLFFAKGIFEYLQAYFMGFVGQRVVTDIRNLLFVNMQKQPLSYFDKTPTGSNISRIVNDVALVQNTVSDSVAAVLNDAFTIIGLIVVAFHMEWKLTLIAFIILPFSIYPIVTFGKRLRKIGLNIQQYLARLTNFLHETITGQRIVKAFSMEEYENVRFSRVNETLFKMTMKRVRVRALSHPVMELIGGIAIAIIIWYGGYQVMLGKTTPGALFSFMAALIMLYEPIKKLNKENHNVQQGLAAAQRVFEVVDRQPEVLEKPDAAELGRVEGRITFHDVSFRYEDKMILNNVDLAIEKNEVIAVVGKSGAGKTTLVNLIPRFYDATKGLIQIDGTDIRDVTLESLRTSIALVTQDVILFNDTIRSNIAYGVEPDEDRIVEASRMAFAHDFIMKLPKKYDTVVGEKGARLSGGQKQRIAIARALYKNAPILILDEATSSLDAQSEIEVQKALDNLMKGRTTIIIAHRLSTIINAHRIIVIDKGAIVQQGNHSALIEEEGPYKKLYELQFKGGARKKVIPIGKKRI